MSRVLPVGKLPVDLLTKLLDRAPGQDPHLLLGPGVGLDCAIIEAGETLFALKSDPITFATEEIGWYAVQVNANDIATTGAIPRWLLVTLLLPEHGTTPELVESIAEGLYDACQDIGVAVVGGHTEITYGLDRPIMVGTMIGEVSRANLVTPRGAQPGDRLLLTKGVPIEATAILAREFPDKLRMEAGRYGSKGEKKSAHFHESSAQQNLAGLSDTELEQAQAFLYDPGISVLREARIATRTGRVHAMHDPTEGGLYSALWELAQACGRSLCVDVSAVPIPALSTRVCHLLGLDPLAAIASGALLLAVPAGEANKICAAIQAGGILCTEIGHVVEAPGSPAVMQARTEGAQLIPRPERDAIAILYEE